MDSVRVVAVDLGASSGRVIVADVGPGRLDLHEVCRFPNEPVRGPSGLHWNLDRVYAGVLAGLVAAAREGVPIASIGIDSWAVDYALVAGGQRVGEVFAYRDEGRCARGPERVHRVISREELQARCGLQYLPFNTIYQMAADDRLTVAESIALVPDLIGWHLTGALRAERTNASTTGLLDPRTRQWDLDLADRIGLPRSLFPPLIDPGQVLGAVSRVVAEQAEEPRLAGIPVVSVASHDTASAVVGTPLAAGAEHAAYLSLGTWGLVGVELGGPLLTADALAANFTNEGGVDGTTRFLTNVMGTWLLSESLRAWGLGDDPTDLTMLLEQAAQLVEAAPIVDVQDPRFAPPGDQPTRIHQWCRERGLTPTATRPEVVASVLVSLATAYAQAVDRAAALTGATIGTVHVVGGGARNGVLCQLIADRAGVEVIAGPVEATAIGNVLVQARGAGVIGPSLVDLRDLVRGTQPLVTYSPKR